MERKYGDCFLCVFFPETIGKEEENTGQKAVDRFIQRVAQGRKRDVLQKIQGLAENRSAAEGYQEQGAGQQQPETVSALAGGSGAVGHFQKPCGNGSEQLGRKGQEGQKPFQQGEGPGAVQSGRKGAEKYHIAADLGRCHQGVPDGGGKQEGDAFLFLRPGKSGGG